jgi:ATP-dependent DNA ligase
VLREPARVLGVGFESDDLVSHLVKAAEGRPGALPLRKALCRAVAGAAVEPHTIAVLAPGFVPPCLPTKAPQPSPGALWLRKIKHDGFRVIARSWSRRCSAWARVPASIDGEAVCCDDKGMPSFNRIPVISFPQCAKSAKI